MKVLNIYNLILEWIDYTIQLNMQNSIPKKKKNNDNGAALMKSNMNKMHKTSSGKQEVE